MAAMNKKILHTVFENTASEFPDRIAVEHGTRCISYAVLNSSAARLSQYLRHLGVKKDSIVGLFLDSSLEYLSSIIGIMKSGGVFMPLDLEFPEKRLEYILNKTVPEVLITSPDRRDRITALLTRLNLKPAPARLLLIDSDLTPSLDGRDGDGALDISPGNLISPNGLPDPNDSIYIMYTSGSTGEPKAIVGCHKSLSHFMHWETTEFDFDTRMKVSQFAPVTFDASLRDFFTPLITGGTVCIPEKEVKSNPRRLVDWLEASGVTLVHCVPSLFRIISKEVEDRGGGDRVFPQLKHILMAGEALYGRDVIKWMDLVGDRIELTNLYGASETTLIKTFNRLRARPANPHAIIPVGQPISNAAILIVKGKQLCSIGEIGDIYIKTPFMTKGYYGDPDLTSRSFVPNPLTNEANDLVYRTGDLGRYLPDRSVEFIGRLDTQVKVNGIRIELAEIERALRGHAALDQAVVQAFKSRENEPTLACYYTEKQPVTADQIREYLLQFLPDYMVPAFFVQLDEFPLNLNGKIDRKALPKPEEMLYDKIKYEPPANDLESQLENIWKDVLGLKKVGVTSPFFEIGGQSLKATRIVSRIYKVLGVEVTLKNFFENSTVRKLADLIGRLGTSIYREIEPAPEQPGYELSAAQRRLWILDQMEGSSLAYQIPTSFLIEGQLDLAAFGRAFHDLALRHQSLRTTFVNVNGRPKQEIHPEPNFTIEEIDLSEEPDNLDLAREYANRQADEPFDLAAGPLVRARLLKLAPDRHVFLLNMHHIITDAWSFDVLAKEILALYHAYVTGRPNPLPPLRIQYKDYSTWQNAWLQSEAIQPHRDYWHRRLAGPLPKLNLPTDYPRPPVQTFNGRTMQVDLDETLLTDVQRLSQEHNVSLFMALMTFVKILIHRYTGQEDILLGFPIAGRNHPDLENQIGFYVNILILRDAIRRQDTFFEVLERVKQTMTEAFDHQVYPFDILVDELDLDKDVSRPPIFDVGVTLQTNDRLALNLDKIKISDFEHDWDISKIDLLFTFTEMDTQLRLDLTYNTDLFKEATIRRMADHLEELIRSVLGTNRAPIDQLNLLSQAEKHKLLEEFNATATAYPQDTTLVALFEQQAAKSPNSPAVEYEGVQLTYDQLNARANQIARYLRDQLHIQPEELVGLMVDRSEWAIIGLLGILKSGGAYLPVDPLYPQDRINYMLEDSRCRVLLTESWYLDLPRPESVNQLIDLRNISTGSATNPDQVSAPQNMAYVIYTSGSTGKPKGVMIEHRAFINMILDQIKIFEVTTSDRVAQFASLSFDASLSETFMALLGGASLILLDRETINNTVRFVQFIKDRGITVITLPPVYLSTLNKHELKPIKTLITAGEPAYVDDALFYARKKRYYNGYGPTEYSVCTAVHRVDPNQVYRNTIPIGTPIANTSVLILDDALQLLPLGVPGEICV
ncbi:MAG: amino acid adenylation domain-containing protein, partial [Deltaproteobacteria bacterium]|nr:amino acid adenylation domain-containing protein [Deltaproteobacteria bacterium]